MPGLLPGIHVLASLRQEDVDGRDKPGHDEEQTRFQTVSWSLKMLAAFLSYSLGDSHGLVS
jgi:hypothetical protein